MSAVLGGCLNPGGGRFELREGEGEDCEDFAPFTEVCTEGGGGRFIFCVWGTGTGLAETVVAIRSILVAQTLQSMDCAIS